MKFFPLDCTKKCPHLKTWDLSVDDWTSVCDILNVQVDDCDGDYIHYRCPLDEKTETNAFEELIVIKCGDGTIYRQRPLVRCKDCKHRDPEDHKCDCGHDIQWQLPRDDDWYCADGEHKSADEILMEEMDADPLG